MNSTNEEHWKPLPLAPYSHFIEVSDKGSVRTKKAQTTITYEDYTIQYRSRNKLHVPNEFGFTRYGRSAHLVARTFIGECPDGYCLHFKDNNPVNSSVGNLEYISCDGIQPTRTVSTRIGGVLTTKMITDERMNEIIENGLKIRYRVMDKQEYEAREPLVPFVSIDEVIKRKNKKMYWEYVVICKMRENCNTIGKRERANREVKEFFKRYPDLINKTES